MRVAIVSNGDAFIKRNVNGRIVYHNRQLEPCDEFQAAREEAVRQILEIKLESWRLRSDLRVVGELEVLWGS